jgi:hypothetical protein
VTGIKFAFNAVIAALGCFAADNLCSIRKTNLKRKIIMSIKFAIIKVIIAAVAISFTSWLSGKRPELAGFIIALPMASILVLAFSYLEHRNPTTSIIFAKSILIGVPVSWLFFAPFFFAEKFSYGFWTSYVSGIILLTVGFLLHRYISSLI